ncbi:hypothetical protein Tco_0525888 [Tanacetum coccineum]
MIAANDPPGVCRLVTLTSLIFLISQDVTKVWLECEKLLLKRWFFKLPYTDVRSNLKYVLKLIEIENTGVSFNTSLQLERLPLEVTSELNQDLHLQSLVGSEGATKHHPKQSDRLCDFMIMFKKEVDNKPRCWEKHLYDSWKSRMELDMMNIPHANSSEAIQADWDIKAILTTFIQGPTMKSML